nr:hypothetical protein CFP56_00453 [Quercus suber]
MVPAIGVSENLVSPCFRTLVKVMCSSKLDDFMEQCISYLSYLERYRPYSEFADPDWDISLEDSGYTEST